MPYPLASRSAFLSPTPFRVHYRQCQSALNKTQICPSQKGYSVPVRMGLLDALKKAINPSSQPSNDNGSTSSNTQNDSSLLDPYFRRVDGINAMESEIEALSDDEIQQAFTDFRTAISSGTTVDQIADRVFALVREASYRVLSLRHYDVQLVGGMVLHDAAIAEMATGEGKTIVAALPAILNALTGDSVFIVTVNDYLARRDAELVGQVFRFCGFSVGLIQAAMEPPERRAAYSCDITYVTNSELGFDYLRDNLALKQSDIVLERPLGYCILDEADSILIDEARTPLIISSRVAANAQKYAIAKKAADALQNEIHYTVNEKEQSVLLTEQGYSDLERALRVDNLFDPKNPWASHITNALKAKELFKKDVNYIVGQSDSKLQIQIIDEFTGRVLKGRRWSDGLHQAVEAKEDIPVDSEASVSAKISYQAFFKLFKKLAGMTGTATTEAKEIMEIYSLSVLPVPTALPMVRKDYPDVVFKTATGKYRGVMREIARVAPTGRPILIGTTSVEASETLSQLLQEVEVEHEVLNAKPESALRESEIIAQAGRKYSITISTNMAGRGTDILLGGNADYFARALARRELVARNEKLYKELNDNEQQVLIDDEELPVDISEDAMRNLEEAVSKVQANAEKNKMRTLIGIDEVVAIASEYAPLPESDNGMVELREAMGVVKEELEDTVAQEREEVLDLGGLYVIGTERAESRRVDNQLRGRAGRQGDPGASRFFLALDDNLFRVFGGDKVKKILDSFRVDEDTPIENPLVNQTLDSSQRTVEDYFRGIRESLFQYDEVLSTQRAVFYKDRRRIVMSHENELNERFLKECVQTAEEIIKGNISKKSSDDDFEKLSQKLCQFFSGIKEVSVDELGSSSNVEARVINAVDQALSAAKRQLDDLRPGFSTEVLRFLWLTQMDNLWLDHMRSMDYVKEMVSLRSYGNEDPLQVFQREGFEMFKDMMSSIRRNNVYSFFQYKVPSSAEISTSKN